VLYIVAEVFTPATVRKISPGFHQSKRSDPVITLKAVIIPDYSKGIHTLKPRDEHFE
jgi:hypothetical protein